MDSGLSSGRARATRLRRLRIFPPLPQNGELNRRAPGHHPHPHEGPTASNAAGDDSGGAPKMQLGRPGLGSGVGNRRL